MDFCLPYLIYGLLLTTSHHLRKSLDAAMEAYIVKFEFSAAFDRVSHSGLLFKLKCIGVGGSVLSICREFIDGAMSEWTPIVSGVPQGGVLGPLLFIIYTSEMFELVENRLYAYADDSTLLAVVSRRRDFFFFRARFTSFYTHAYLLTFFICCFIVFDSCCSHSRVWENTLA